MNLKEEIAKLIEGEVEDNPDELKKHSHDASIFEITPKLVVYPKNVDDLKKLVKFAASRKENRISFTARSGGTDMSGGALTESVVVDFTRYFNRIGEVKKTKNGGEATVEPGVFYRDFEKETLKKNLLMPSYPASREICAVGGMVANNAGGEKTLRYGKTEKYVKEIKAVMSDGEEYVFRPLTMSELEKKMSQKNFEGELYRKVYKLINENYEKIKSAKPNVSKNSAGYFLWNVWDKEKGIFDLTQLLVGSQGTLGLITEIKFSLIEPKPHSRLLVIFMRDINILADLINKVLHFEPESFESYDDKTLKLVFRYIFSFMKLLGMKNIFKLAWSFLPEAKMVLTGGFPKLILLAEFTGDSEEEVVERAKETRDALREFKGISLHLARNKEEAKKYWTIRREAFNLIRYHLKDKRSEPFIDDLIVRPERLSEFLPKLYKILNEYSNKMTYAIGGHSGDGNMHIYSLINPDLPDIKELISEASAKVYDLVIKMEGSITAEHNDGLIRSPYLRKMYGDEIFKLFEEVKKIFDPQNIFNPGKKVGADLEYSLSHLRK